MTQPLSIATSQTANMKTRLKEWLGSATAIISPQRTTELHHSPLSAPNGLRDKLLMAYLKRKAIDRNEATFFERLHIDFWQGEGGAVFSENCDHRFADLFLEKQREDFLQLQSIWAQLKPKHIVEFGCNSGLLLRFLVDELPGVESATGIDINPEQIRKNKASQSFDERIHFSNSEGGKWLAENGVPHTLFVSNGGVLEYFRRERLDEMLTRISSQLSPSVFFAVEPVACDHDWQRTRESIPFGNELSFSHNYQDLFESNGFEIRHQRAVQFESWNMVATIAVSQG